MAYRRIFAAVLFTAAVLGGSAQAQNANCRKQCDVSFNSCNKGGKGDVCLRTWHGCKKQCVVSPSAAAKQTPAPGLQARR
jgi:hypothetical protein